MAKPGRKSKAEKAAEGMTQIAATLGDNSAAADREIGEEFIRFYHGPWRELKSKEALFHEQQSQVHDAAKAKGFLVKELKWYEKFKGTPEQHKAALEDIEMPTRVLKWAGDPLGAQLSLHLDQPEEKMPPLQVAYALGIEHCVAGKAARPPYVPGDLYQRYMDGYHAETGRRVKNGIKPLAGDGKLDEAEPDSDPPLPKSLAQYADPARPL